MKTKVCLLLDYYQKMFKKIMHWGDNDYDLRYYEENGRSSILGKEEDHYLYDAVSCLEDVVLNDNESWFNELWQHEIEMFDKIEFSYFYLLKSLAEAIGYKYPENDRLGKILKKIDTDDILKLRNRFDEKNRKL